MLPPLSEAEQKLWCLDQRINARGFYCDGCLIERAIAIATAADNAVQAEIKQITGGEIDEHQSGRQDRRLAGGARLRRQRLAKSDAVAGAAADRASAPEVRRVIELRREAAHACANKFQALRAWRCLDGRVRGAFKFHGAATGRWSGAGPQPQNFRRETRRHRGQIRRGDVRRPGSGAPARGADRDRRRHCPRRDLRAAGASAC